MIVPQGDGYSSESVNNVRLTSDFVFLCAALIKVMLPLSDDLGQLPLTASKLKHQILFYYV